MGFFQNIENINKGTCKLSSDKKTLYVYMGKSQHGWNIVPTSIGLVGKPRRWTDKANRTRYTYIEDKGIWESEVWDSSAT